MESDHQLLYVRGRDAMESGRLAEAIELLKTSAESYPHFKTYESIGECLLQEGRCKEAILFLSASAGLGNKPFRAFFLLAKALLGTGELQQASDKLMQALSINRKYRAAQELLDSINSER
jgi:tetratricopeptide (TPR) repeat protein